MARRIPIPACGALAWVAMTCVALAEESTRTLEQKLREQRADVVRWETKLLGRNSAPPGEGVGIVAVGRIGSRTPVRYADGRVRWFRVSGMRPVRVASHAIESGSALLASDTAIAERDVIALACDPVTAIDGARWRATRRLAAGDALCLGGVEIAPDVERDRPVLLRAQRGDVSASRVLTANTDARAGEVVRLRDPTSGASVVAIVTGSGTARVFEEQK